MPGQERYTAEYKQPIHGVLGHHVKGIPTMKTARMVRGRPSLSLRLGSSMPYLQCKAVSASHQSEWCANGVLPEGGKFLRSLLRS